MPLPDVSRLLAVPKATYRALGARLRTIGLDAGTVRASHELTPGALPAMRLPLQTWHARRRTDVVGSALRLWMLGDPVTVTEATAVLGAVSVPALITAGLLTEDAKKRVTCPFRLDVVGADYVLSDHLEHAGDAVMGDAASTNVLAYAGVRKGMVVRRALDLGCGAGTLAILLARECEAVVATDVNPRALVLARVNAMIGGIDTIEFRQGDLFTPVRGERFDLILSQPPFVGAPEGSAPTPYLYGGRRGDELGTALLGGVMEHLTPGGRAVVLMEWPTAATDPSIEARAHAAAPAEDVDALVVLGPEVSLDQHCMAYAAAHHPTLDAAYAGIAVAFRQHLASMNVEKLQMAIHVYERASSSGRGRPGFVSSVSLRRYGDAVVTSAHVDRWMAARDLAARGAAAVLEAKVVVTQGALFEPDPRDAGKVIARLPAESLLDAVVINVSTHKLLAYVDRAAKVRDAAESLAKATGMAKEEAEAKVVAGVTQGLLIGLLLPSTGSL